MTHISEVLGWKFDYAPGIQTVGDEITNWPDELGSLPTKKQLKDWTAEYEAYKLKEATNAGIYEQLTQLDIKAIRPLLDGETERIAEIQAQKAALRAQLIT